MKWFLGALIVTTNLTAFAGMVNPNSVLENRDIKLNKNGVLPIQGNNYNYELGKGPNDSQVINSKISGLYDLVVKRSAGTVISTTETVKESENIYATKHAVYGDKDEFFITNCRSKKGTVINDVVCNSINTEICDSYSKLKEYDKDLFAKVNSCIDIEKQIDSFKNSYKKATEKDVFKKKHILGREEGRTALNKYANTISITDVFNREMGKNLDKNGILEASWLEVSKLVKACPGVAEINYYSLNDKQNGLANSSDAKPKSSPSTGNR